MDGVGGVTFPWYIDGRNDWTTDPAFFRPRGFDMIPAMTAYTLPILLVFIGALIVAVGTAFTREGWPRYAILTGSVLAAMGVMWIGFNQAGYNTGGDSFIYLEPSFIGPGGRREGIVDISLRHRGLYPVYDTYIRIVDLEKFSEAVKVRNGLDLYRTQYERYRNFERLDPNRIVMNFERWQLPSDADYRGYNIFFSSRNREYAQALRFRRINGEWMVSMQVAPLGGGQTLLEQGLQFLPHDEKGRPQW
jgi:hypothetical protein